MPGAGFMRERRPGRVLKAKHLSQIFYGQARLKLVDRPDGSRLEFGPAVAPTCAPRSRVRDPHAHGVRERGPGDRSGSQFYAEGWWDR